MCPILLLFFQAAELPGIKHTAAFSFRLKLDLTTEKNIDVITL